MLSFLPHEWFAFNAKFSQTFYMEIGENTWPDCLFALVRYVRAKAAHKHVSEIDQFNSIQLFTFYIGNEHTHCMIMHQNTQIQLY